MDEQEVYAKVERGEIVEYPVYRLHIENREHPFTWYTPVKFEEKPNVSKYYTFDEVKAVKPGYVLVSYMERPKTLAELLAMVKELGYESHDGVYTPPAISEVPQELITTIYAAVSLYVTKVLNDFAAKRNYGTDDTEPFAALMTYLGSKVDRFRTEAEIGRDHRDQIWAALLDYFDKVKKGEVKVPTQEADILTNIPELKWDN